MRKGAFEGAVVEERGVRNRGIWEKGEAGRAVGGEEGIMESGGEGKQRGSNVFGHFNVFKRSHFHLPYFAQNYSPSRLVLLLSKLVLALPNSHFTYKTMSFSILHSLFILSLSLCLSHTLVASHSSLYFYYCWLRRSCSHGHVKQEDV